MELSLGWSTGRGPVFWKEKKRKGKKRKEKDRKEKKSSKLKVFVVK